MTRLPHRRALSAATFVALAVASSLGCDHAVSLRLTPQSPGLLDGLDGSIRVYSVPFEFACPGSELDNGTASSLWPDRCTDARIEPFVRMPAESHVAGATLVREVEVAGSTPAMAVGELDTGRYAFVYVGLRDGCDVAALGCSVVAFPADIRIDVAPPVGVACLSGCLATRPTSQCVSCMPP